MSRAYRPWIAGIVLLLGACSASAQETVPIGFSRTQTTTSNDFVAALGGGPKMLWKETLATNQEWPTSRSFQFEWGAGSWVARWLSVKMGEPSTDAIWNGRLRAAGRCGGAGQEFLDAFWEYPRIQEKLEPGMLHGRFMRIEERGLIYCRLQFPTPTPKPIRVVFCCHPGVYWANANVENLAFTAGTKQVVHGLWDGKKYRDKDLEGNLSAEAYSTMVLTRRTDLTPLHAGATLAFLPEEVASVRLLGEKHDIQVELTLKPECGSLHFAFGGYNRGNAAHNAKRLKADHPAIRAVLTADWWQTTRPSQAVDAAKASRRLKELTAECFGAEGAAADAADLGGEKEGDPGLGPDGKPQAPLPKAVERARKIVERWTALAADDKPLADPKALCRLYEESEELRRIELRLQAIFLRKLDKGK